jgi:two-component system chemotaxis response regulator CheB
VQDPADAVHRSMPLSALDNVAVDHKVPVAEIGPLLGRLAREEAAPEPIFRERERARPTRARARSAKPRSPTKS